MTPFWQELAVQVLSTGFLVGVLGNLAAAVICGVPALWHLHRKLDRQQAELAAQAAVNHTEQLALAALRHAELLAAGIVRDGGARLLADVKTAGRDRRPAR